jgi:hypothetical protein
VYGARVAADGTVAEPDGIVISATGDQDVPEDVVAGPGKGHTAVYQRLASEAPYGGAPRGFIRTVTPK